MNGKVDRHISQLAQGDHACLIYQDASEQIANVVPFIEAGLHRGERCVYMSDDRTAEAVTASLRAAGVVKDVDSELERQRRAFWLLTTHEAYLRSGSFDPARMIVLLKQLTDQALADGFQGLRVTGETTWALGPEPGCDWLIEYEARVNEFFPGSRALALCQYDRPRSSPALIRDVLRTHPTVVVENGVCRNSPTYDRPTRPPIITDGATVGPEGKRLADVGTWIPTYRKPDDIVLFPERDAAGRILVWRLVAHGVVRWSPGQDLLFAEGRRLARERHVSLCVVARGDAKHGELIESYRRGPWRRPHGDWRWEASVLRRGTRFAASVASPGGHATLETTCDSLLDALEAADRAVPAHACPETCQPWWAED